MCWISLYPSTCFTSVCGGAVLEAAQISDVSAVLEAAHISDVSLKYQQLYGMFVSG